MISLGIQVLLVLAVTYGGVQADIGCLSFGANTSVNAVPGVVLLYSVYCVSLLLDHCRESNAT